MDINDFFQKILEASNSGKDIDRGLLAILPNALNNDTILHNIAINRIEHLLTMLKEADDCLIYFSGQPTIIAHYKFSDAYPVSRIYYMQCMLFDLPTYLEYFKRNLISFTIIDDERLSKIIGKVEVTTRISKYLANKCKNTEYIQALFKGRKAMTNLTNGLFLNSKTCFFCGKKENLTNATTTLNNFMFGYVLCEEHKAEAINYDLSFINYFSYKYFEMILFEADNFDSKTHFHEVSQWFPKVRDLKIKKISIENKTITLTRNSGVGLILRMTEPLDYAYIILDKNNKEIIRIDSAKHHPEIDFFPDHLHLGSDKKKQKIEPSFSTGSPFFDLKGIIKLIENIEKQES